MMNNSVKDNQEKKRKVYKETDDRSENQTSGETSSANSFDRSSLTKMPGRKNKPLGSSHEPGVTPGTE
ncbi:hypothetical protein [Pedobacter ginsengisoli]|uniref:hypothetical protein n=1 Tax=Pedobacter ginsengisoli TaxID=363852 RepID=UPI0025518013|nr:hypothetical protein [Pedobacter ginsengisoli]